MEDEIPQFSICPRCRERGFELLGTHGHCVACLHTPDLSLEYEAAAHEGLRVLSEALVDLNDPESRLMAAETEADRGVA